MRCLVPASAIALLSLLSSQANATIIDYTGISIINTGPSVNVSDLGASVPSGSTFNLTNMGDALQPSQSGTINNALYSFSLDGRLGQVGYITGYISDNERIVFKLGPDPTGSFGQEYTSRTYAMPEGPLSVFEAAQASDTPLTATDRGFIGNDIVTFAALDVPAGGYFIVGFEGGPSSVSITYSVSKVPLRSSLSMMAIALTVLAAAGPLSRRISIGGPGLLGV